MNLKRSVVVITILIFVLLPATIYAQTYYYRWQPSINFTCGPSGSGVEVVLSGQPVEWNLPAGASYTINYIDNGVVTPTGPFPLPVGMGSQLFGAFSQSFSAYPFTFAIRLDTIISGSVVYSSSVSVNCAGDSSGAATITNSVGGTGSGASYSKPVFTDGRLNPDPGAPVAIYCNSTGVTILQINQQSSRGENALTVSSSAINLALDQAASTKQNILAGGNTLVGLYALPSKELQVQVNFEKQYNFIFLASRCAFSPGTEASAASSGTASGGTSGSSIYVVQPGDTLAIIAARFGISIDGVQIANGITNPNLIFVGQTLIIPASAGGSVAMTNFVTTAATTINTTPVSGSTYIVRAGDNLFRIALNHGVSLSDLQRINNIPDPTRIFVGQVLTIP
ncbi:MAG: LysM peptidoglycan-binding domain-containing protein [Anaerolineae bacterium]